MKRSVRALGLVAAALALTLGPTTTASASDTLFYVNRMGLVYSEYGGPTTIGSTADELITARCQHNGAWGWQTYAWVPSLNQNGWIRNEDVTGFTNPIPGLDVC